MPMMPKRVRRFNENELRAAVQEHVDKTHQMKSIASNLRGMVGQLAMNPDDEEDEELLGPAQDFGSSASSWNPAGTPRTATVQPRATKKEIRECKTQQSFTSPPRGRNKSRLIPVVFSAPDDLLSDDSNEANGEASSSDASSSNRSSVSAVDPDRFDAERWQGRVMELLTSLHANDEVEAMQALYKDFASRSVQRTVDACMLEEVATERLEELAEIDKAGGSIADSLEQNQLALMGRIGGFTEVLKGKMDEIRERRRKEAERRKKAARQFTFAGMKAYHPTRKDESSKTPDASDQQSPTGGKRMTVRGAPGLAQGLLKSISTQQTQIAAMEAKILILRKRLDAHQSTVKHLEACKGDKASAPTDGVKEVLQQCMTRWVIRSRADSTSTQVVEAELAKEEAGILLELEAEVEMLKQRSKELQDSAAAAATAAAGTGDRRPSQSQLLGAALAGRGDRAKAGGSRTTSRRTSKVASTEAELPEAKAPTRWDAMRAVVGKRAEMDEEYIKAKVDQAEKELSALEAKTVELEKERSLFMASLTRSHRVWRQPNVASRAGLAAAAAAVAAAAAAGAANGSSASDSDSDGEPPVRRSRTEPTKEPSANLLAPPAPAPATAAPAVPQKSDIEEAAERKAAEEADAQQSAWFARQSRLAAACGGDAPADIAEGEKVLARQQREILELQERLREAIAAQSVRRASKTLTEPEASQSAVSATSASEPAAEGGAEVVEGATPLSSAAATPESGAAESALAAGEAGPAEAATGRAAADPPEPVGPTGAAAAAGTAGDVATEGEAELAEDAAAVVAAVGGAEGADIATVPGRAEPADVATIAGQAEAAGFPSSGMDAAPADNPAAAAAGDAASAVAAAAAAPADAAAAAAAAGVAAAAARAVTRRRSRSAGSARSGGEGDGADPQQLEVRLERAKGEERRLSKELAEQDELLKLVEGKDHLEPEEAEKVRLALQRRLSSEAFQHDSLDDQVEALRRQVASLRKAVAARQREERRRSVHLGRGASADRARQASGSKSAPRAPEEELEAAQPTESTMGPARQTLLELQASRGPALRGRSRNVPRDSAARGAGRPSTLNPQELGVIAHRIAGVARPAAKSLAQAPTRKPQDIFAMVRGSLLGEHPDEG